MRIPTTLAALAAATLAAPVAAQTFEPPEGCTGYLTVQQRGCTLSNHYICDADPEGHQWRVDFMQRGPVFASLIDGETQWLESLGLVTGLRRSLGETPDPASLTELLETGIDTYDFTTVDPDGAETRWRGADVLTGETVEIDGVELLAMTYTTESVDPDGSVTRARGSNFVSEEWGMFLPGLSTVLNEAGEPGEPDDNTPVLFIEPGEEGFFGTQPIYDCDAADVAFPLN